jgi:RNA polymerase sigma factor (sigma-70 family)
MFFPPCRHGGLLLGQPAVAGFRRNEKPGGDAVRAAARIFEEYGGLIRAVIRYQVHNRSEEEDLFQEFFITLVRKPVPAHVLKLKSYLYKAVINHVVDSGRRRQSYRRAVKKYAEEIGIRINNRTSGNASIENTEERNAVIAYFARHLQHREAQAFVLRYRDNFSNGQIAAEMGVDVKTVSRYLSDGLRRLRKALAT